MPKTTSEQNFENAIGADLVKLNVIEKKGTLHALRKGVVESGWHFDLCFFPPSGGGDAELEKLYQGNFSQALRDEGASGGGGSLPKSVIKSERMKISGLVEGIR